MKKIVLVCLVLVLSASLLCACAKEDVSGAVMDGYLYGRISGYDGALGVNGFQNKTLVDEYFETSSYTQIVENEYVNAAEKSDIYVSLDNNTASYSNLRGMINAKVEQIPADAVRVEEMLNYFSFDYNEPGQDQDFAFTYSLYDAPYNKDVKLLSLGLKAAKVETSDITNNIVFLIDVSGSMYGADRLGLIQESFKLVCDVLKPQDRVSIVTYASGVSVALEGAYGYEGNKIRAVIEDLSASGGTNGEGGIELAYKTAQKYFVEGGNNRVILATDGDFNIGNSSVDGITALIKEKRQSGVYLSVLGVGFGNFKSDMMESLALNGNGNFAYLDSLLEARKVLVEEFGGTFYTIAKDAKLKIDFNKDVVESYRLIGYENKQMSEDDFNDKDKDAGEIGSGHSVTCVFEVKLKENASGTLAEATLRYKTTADELKESRADIGAEDTEITNRDRFISAIIEFAMILKDSEYKGSADADSIAELLSFVPECENDYFKDFYDLAFKYFVTEKEIE